MHIVHIPNATFIYLFSETMLAESEIPVATQVTTFGQLVPSEADPCTTRTETQPSVTTLALDVTVILEGWQKSWEESQYKGIASTNIRWLRDNEQYGLFESAKPFKTSKGEVTQRKLMKDKMEFNPPPIPVTMKGSVPNMLAFFTTPVFLWRPVGVMEAKVKCPNTNCLAPAGSYLIKRGFSTIARQVCGMKNYYTLLTERLTCTHCHKIRQAASQTDQDSDGGEQEEQPEKQQYMWHAYSPKIMASLAPAVRSLFPAILCARRAVDRNVVTLLSDRVNAASMNKVQKLVKKTIRLTGDAPSVRFSSIQIMLYALYNSSAVGIFKKPGRYGHAKQAASIAQRKFIQRAVNIAQAIPALVYVWLTTTKWPTCLRSAAYAVPKNHECANISAD